MTLTRRGFNQTLLGAIGVALLPWQPAVANLIEGRDWRAISPPQPRGEAGKIEVLEFFSYSCPHCGDLNPLIKPWAAALPPDVTFKRVPVTFGRVAMANLARLFHALEYSGDLERLDQDIFTALHRERVKLFTEKDILDWVASRGVDPDEFKSLFNSFAVETQLKRADTLVQRFRIDAVPTITVDGRFVVTGGNSHAERLIIADQVILMARDQVTVS
ncbi:MAG: thiol:disulfide interchange protein DsbA/DsbL [Sphingobacteriia bacterium]|nr:thiol:disulfide interchange protein DsbA/DsbL [Sphingobacteriia bacterium]NCC39951.1 thiol:disulfide interchange protein DsbA/DsbL [Gammaproteobacteria bacterium]